MNILFFLFTTILLSNIDGFQKPPFVNDNPSTVMHSYPRYIETEEEAANNIFFDINKIYHEFPEDVSKMGFPVTLLHKHSHDHGFLAFNKNFNESNYIEDTSNYYPCSWYFDNDKNVVAYEFCEENIKYEPKVIKNRLLKLNKLGYKHYGTTVRKITEAVEYETTSGHIYQTKEEYRKNTKNSKYKSVYFSKTAVVYNHEDSCVMSLVCVMNHELIHICFNAHVDEK